MTRAFFHARRAVRHGATLLQLWTAPEENPFLQRALRVEQRKHKPFLIVALLMSLILILNGGLWWFWTWLLGQSRPLRELYTPFDLPPQFGGNWVSGVAIGTLTCCVITAIFVCASRAAQNLRREMLGGTLEQLILLPQREERWLWLMRAQPLALALLIYFCGLPVFAFAVFTDIWNGLDLIGLLFLFIGIGHWAPLWTPLQWQARQNQGQKFDLRAWQAAVRSLQQEGKEAKGEAATLEIQRRMARLWEKMEPASATATNEGKKRVLVGASALGGAANTGNNWRLIIWVFMMQLIGPGMTLMRLSGNPIATLWGNLQDALPQSVLQMAPAFPLTWPLLLVRVLWSPLPFFALALPPILLYAPLWVARQISGNLQLAALVSPGETFWTARRLRTRRTCTRWIFWCGLLLFLGYSWTTLINDAVLALLLRGASPPPTTPAWALATLYTLCLMVGVFITGEAKEKPFKRYFANDLPLVQAWRQAAQVAVAYFLLAIVAYLVFCLLGRQPFFSPPVAQRFVPVFVTALAYVIADYGSSALQAALPEAQRGSCKAAVSFWTAGLALIALVYIVAGFYYQRPFSFEQAPFVVLSPFVTLPALLRADLNSGVVWWIGPFLQIVIGLVLLLSAALKTFGVRPAHAPMVAVQSEDRLPAPLKWLLDALSGLWDGVVAFFEGCTELMRRADDGIVQWSKRFANPVLTEELQRRLRREHWPLGWAILILMAVGFFAQGVYFAGASLQGRYVGGIALLAMLFLGFISSLRVGLVFDRDRANGTLVFVFLTPLTEKEIAWGKLLANLIYSGGTLLILLPFLLIGLVLELVNGEAQLALAGAALFLFALSFVAYFSGFGLLCGIWARKPTQGMSLALLLGLLGQVFFFFAPAMFMIFAGDYLSETFYFVSGVAIFLLNCLASFFAWRGSLKLLRQQRYSDDVTSGKRTG